MMLPHDIDERARNVWDIFYDWQGDSLSDCYRVNAERLRSSSVPRLKTAEPEERAAIFTDGDRDDYRNARIEYRRSDDIEYIMQFCKTLMLQAADLEQGKRLLRIVLYREQQRQKSAEVMTKLFNELYAGFWIADLEFAATWLLLCMSSPDWQQDSVGTIAPNADQLTGMFGELRKDLDEAKETSTDLDEWFYRMFCLMPRSRMLEAICSKADDESRKFARFLDEARTDFSAVFSVAADGWLRGTEYPVSSVYLDYRGLDEMGDIRVKHSDGTIEVREKVTKRPHDVKELVADCQFTMASRYTLPEYWYKTAIEYYQEGKAIHKNDSPPDKLDAFNPLLAGAIRTLLQGKIRAYW